MTTGIGLRAGTTNGSTAQVPQTRLHCLLCFNKAAAVAILPLRSELLERAARCCWSVLLSA